MSTRLPEALLRSQSDERLAALAGRGRERAFDMLVERYQKPLLGFARSTTGAEHAEDVVQQAFTQAWAALQEGTEVHHVRGWLYQIVRHGSWKATAQAATTRQLEPALAGTDNVHSTIESRMELRNLVDNVVELPAHQRIALVQTAFEGRSRSEIAATLGVTEGAVRQLVHRGRERLRKAAAGLIPLPVLNWLAHGHGRGGSVAARSGDVARVAVESPGMFEGASKAVLGLVAAGVVAAGAGGGIVHHQLNAPANERATAAERAAFDAKRSAGAAANGSAAAAGAGGSAASRAVSAGAGLSGARSDDTSAGTGANAAPGAREAGNPGDQTPASSPQGSEAPGSTPSGSPDDSPGDGSGSAPSAPHSGSHDHEPATDPTPDSSPDPSPDTAPADGSTPDPSVDKLPADVPVDGE
jgi:RNA polymerase sigma factor (sigma-70 family)